MTTKSVDSLSIEVYEDKGAEYITISRFSLNGAMPGMTFRRGDPVAAARPLGQLAELFGVGPLIIQEKQ